MDVLSPEEIEARISEMERYDRELRARPVLPVIICERRPTDPLPGLDGVVIESQEFWWRRYVVEKKERGRVTIDVCDFSCAYGWGLYSGLEISLEDFDSVARVLKEWRGKG